MLDLSGSVTASPALFDSLRAAATGTDRVQRMIDHRVTYLARPLRLGSPIDSDIRMLRIYNESHRAHGRRLAALTQRLVHRLEGLQ